MKRLRAHLPTPVETDALGRAIALALLQHEITNGAILLQGPLGAGKSSLVRALLRALGVTGPIPSPTYTLVEPYFTGGIAVSHLDLYRLSGAGELEMLGGRELFEQLLLVEWPERAPELFDRAHLGVKLAMAGAARSVELQANDPTGSWCSVLNEVSQRVSTKADSVRSKGA